MTISKQMQDLIDQASESEDQSAVQANFEFDITPAGKTMARLIEYIETGKRKQSAWQGQAKKDCEMVRLTFELLSKKHVNTVVSDGKEVEFTNTFTIQLPKKLSGKAKFHKLFKKLDYGRGNTHIAQMLGEGFIIELFHNDVGEGDQKKTYVNLNPDGGEYVVNAPVAEDMDSGEKTNLNIPPATRDLKLFLWDKPTPETWMSLFIDGTRTKKVDGVDTEVSKNWLQEMIMEATDMGGSPLEQMINGVDDLPEFQPDPVEEVADEPEVKKTPAGAAEKETTSSKSPAPKETSPAATTASPSEEEVDPLVAMGLA